MNFGYKGGPGKCFYFHCATEGKKIDMIRKNDNVCIEIDTDHISYEGNSACDFGMGYRSVVGMGKMVIIEDNDEKRKGLDFIMGHYSGRSGFSYSDEALAKIFVLRLDITELTGKKNIPDFHPIKS
jgi:nitroimidazol reductase NimA-like FMN-containing flavoprotein (pyridoxamine 5'-phosphate oxidase superfamily)